MKKQNISTSSISWNEPTEVVWQRHGLGISCLFGQVGLNFCARDTAKILENIVWDALCLYCYVTMFQAFILYLCKAFKLDKKQQNKQGATTVQGFIFQTDGSFG